MNPFKRFGLWLERVAAPPVRLVPCILTDTSGHRTFNLQCRSNWLSSMAWPDFPPSVIDEFVREFEECAERLKDSGMSQLYDPYLQFYAGDSRTPSSCAGVSTCDEAIGKTFDEIIGTTFALARGKIRPTSESEVVFDGVFLTFTQVRLEFTVGEHRDMVHTATSITIGPEGEIVVD